MYDDRPSNLKNKSKINNNNIIKNSKYNYLFQRNFFYPEITQINNIDKNEEESNIDYIKNKIKNLAIILKDEKKEIDWDYNNDNQFQCKIDKKNEINFIVIKTYSPDDLFQFFDALENCFKLVYENNYPIIFMTEQNGGGIGAINHLIIELLSPFHPYNEFVAVRKNLIKFFNFLLFLIYCNIFKKNILIILYDKL